MSTLAEVIEHKLEEAGLSAAVEEDGDAIVLSGMVRTEDERRAVLEVATDEAPGYSIEDNIEVESMLAEDIGELRVTGMGDDAQEGSEPGASDESLEAGDFTDQRLLKYAGAASGPSDNLEDDHVSEGDVVYVPPTDPVRDREGGVLGGFAITSMDQEGVARSSDGAIGDEALADAIRRELAEDAATSDLAIDVTVEQGVVRLSGRVRDVDDAEAAEAVASRLAGVQEVLEELTVESL